MCSNLVRFGFTTSKPGGKKIESFFFSMLWKKKKRKKENKTIKKNRKRRKEELDFVSICKRRTRRLRRTCVEEGYAHVDCTKMAATEEFVRVVKQDVVGIEINNSLVIC
jgi:hypothetical protein